ncbi:peptidase M23 [Clostridium botulinum]|uniref:peptidoglycan DD-metalloendopeptidase family protein n=1 Tax=Clostridium botulinum TaxID=1491 RepID=UPI00217E1DA1|nr:M23 family metallopeptidase [Clostridium botulinum]MCS6105224.1 peptidase M23 [Clostridium botulinum]MCS6108650.1 peptidase M23 [Clostridium botulinum]
MNTRKMKVIKFIICLTVIFNSIILIANANSNKVFEAYVDGRLVGYIYDKKEFKQIYSGVNDELNKRLGTDLVQDKKLRFKTNKENIEKSSEENIKKNIKKIINDEVDAKLININNKDYGIVFNENEASDVFKDFIMQNLNKFNIKLDSVLNTEINANVKYSDVKVPISNVNDIKQIVDNMINDENIKVDVKIKEEKEVTVAPKTQIKRDDSMYIGESNIKEGEAGSKKVTAEVTYRNGEKLNENIISEYVTKETKDRIEYRGSKTPIGTKATFLQYPTRGRYITSKFGPRWGKTHNGIDIAGNTGDPVTAAFNGVIEEAGVVSGYGNMIKIKHEDGLETLYGHLSSIHVKKGQEIKKGDVIGAVGSTGRSTGPHLHFELRSKGTPINPESYIKQ